MQVRCPGNFFKLTAPFEKKKRRAKTMSFNVAHQIRLWIKTMIMATIMGYVITSFGPLYSDFHHNDASILKNIILNSYENIFRWTKDNDVMILNRGVRNSLVELKTLGIDAATPSFLCKSQRQFDVYDNNRSRLVMKLRQMVEHINIRFKRFI